MLLTCVKLLDELRVPLEVLGNSGFGRREIVDSFRFGYVEELLQDDLADLI